MRSNANDGTISFMQLDICDLEAPFINLDKVPKPRESGKERTRDVS